MTATEPRVHEPSANPTGIGHRVPRAEDARLIRGHGRFVDDITLPGMLHMAFTRAPVAHARIAAIDTSVAAAQPGVVAVITGADLAEHGLAWMPTLSGDTQAVMATDKVRFQGQEVAAVVAETPYQAWDAAGYVDVTYEDLPPVLTPQAALADGAPLVRDEKVDQDSNHIYHWEAGDRPATDAMFAQADRVIALDTLYPRSHPAPLETCGALADIDGITGKATIYLTSQAPHAHRTLFALVTGLPEQKIRIVAPDIGGGFGNKVPIYPGYVVASAASLLLGKPVKWIESRSENLISTGFARDYHLHGELAVRDDGTFLGLRVGVLGDHGAFYGDAQPSKLRAGLFHVVTGSYDLPAAFVEVDGAYTNKACGGVAYRCSFRITEASYLIERLVENAAVELGRDPADLRRQNFIRPEQFPYTTATGLVYDSGEYEQALDLALAKLDYAALRAEQRRAWEEEGRLIGIGLASFTELVGAGRGRDYDIAGLRMFDSAELRIHPTGKAILKLGVRHQGQGHETTFAQIVSDVLGIPAGDIEVVEGDTDNTPFGLGTYGSRSTPTGGAATAVISRTLRDKAVQIAAHLLEASPDDIRVDNGRFYVAGSPEAAKTIQDVAFAAYSDLPEGMEPGLEGVHYYDPPEFTAPFGTYAVVVEIDRGTGEWHVQRVVAVDDCGVRINPTIVEGQLMGGLTEGYATAAMQQIAFDDLGNCLSSNFTEYLLPSTQETPAFELHETVTPSPHHPIGAKGVGESATVGSPAAYVNAIIDALAPHGIRNLDMPVTSAKVWKALRDAGLQRP